MSKCISSEGEYSDHELAEQPRFMCARCFVFDEDAALAALDEAADEIEKAIAEVARQQALRVENGKRFEQMRSERTAALARAEAAEAKLANVSGFVDGLMGDETNTVAVSVGRGLRAALAPVTEEGDKE